MCGLYVLVDLPPSTKLEKFTQQRISETHGIKSFFSKAMIAAGIGIPENYLHSVFPFKCDVTFILNSASLLYAFYRVHF